MGYNMHKMQRYALTGTSKLIKSKMRCKATNGVDTNEPWQ
jgi:hypothetical protein